MAQPQQQQYPMPQRPFSPAQNTASSGAPQQFGLPPNKRQRLSPTPTSQPGSPYVASPYGTSPNTPANTTGASPHFSTVGIPQGVYNTPYSNGLTNPTLTLPQSQPGHQSQPNRQAHFQGSTSFANPPHTTSRPDFANYATAQPQQQLHPNPHSHPHQQHTQNQYAGTMGPPSKPVEKPKEDLSDPMDILAGTGVDLREEEQYMFATSNKLFNKSFNSNVLGPNYAQPGMSTSGFSFTQFPPGNEASFYGAGPANVIAENVGTKSQDEFLQEAADKAWAVAARNVGMSRQNELDHPFLNVQVVQAKMGKFARENGLSTNLEGNGMGYMKVPDNFNNREVRIQSRIGPEAGFIHTSGSFIPADAMVVDQVALLSIATKHRLQGLVEGGVKLARGRQTGSHGVLPEEWADAAVPVNYDSHVPESGLRNGWESAVSPHSNQLDRSLSIATKLPTPVSDSANPSAAPKLTSEVAAALRSSASQERDQEEARLRKRLARAAGEGVSRPGSIVPGTPGSIAPDSMDKAPTKKEQKKKADAKVNEAATHAAANTTTAQFLGGGRGFFGKKKKTYSWMNPGGAGGAGGSGASTPGRISTQGLPGISGSLPLNAPPEKLTADGVRRLGTWRDDSDKGRHVQIRDWISVLEQDGREKKALQMAYMWLDQSEPK
ncbi:hypothetical protein BUE80_DR001741 [Diplocarpon rosae]|nr:hypothetical protein BUE80_DR001741 [Diplocarpon rosae]